MRTIIVGHGEALYEILDQAYLAGDHSKRKHCQYLAETENRY